VGLVAFVVALAVLLIMPVFAAPRLAKAFSAVPQALYGLKTQRLMSWADLIVSHGWLLILLAMAVLGAWVWSFGHLLGPLRQVLDRLGPWRLYRDMQAIRFLMMTATLLRTLQQRGVTLRHVLLVQQGCANRWVGWHLQQMIRQIDRGIDPIDALHTGLMSDQARWCLLDVVRVRGLSDGLLMASSQISEQITESMVRRALVWRWLLLVTAVGAVFAMGAWHVEVIEEMRRALTLMYG
jgi:type II secretory pathway component PulF